MIEKALLQFSLDTLLQLIVDSTAEYLDAKEKGDDDNLIEEKKRNVDIIRKAIIQKRTDYKPGSSL